MTDLRPMLALLFGATACVAPIDAGEVSFLGTDGCKLEAEAHFFAAAGRAAGTSLALSDPDPDVASVSGTDGDTSFELEGTADSAQYAFSLSPWTKLVPGMHDVVRKGVEEGIAMELLVQRPSLGRFELTSIAGIIDVRSVTADEITGAFEADLGARGNAFRGCFHVGIGSDD